MHRRLGSATLSQLTFLEESDPNFPWEDINTVVKKKKKKEEEEEKEEANALCLKAYCGKLVQQNVYKLFLVFNGCL